ncbi:DNA-3-methyladenine glycosylase [Neobacillus sp. PS3-34]|uniref:DNA-3-methyladenine glycosylase family protein n=1 Tax=Neobacillus sp. PS3-34 TaxID=3070678 RepID=UPI0027E122E3|nr:DNA-3-methyladenine glycosylase [Neobacillus sp. PS3-34]WML49859.1 DNA-3-methyladenine glycosylase [Neobacillus sp. PS3-34]
MWHETIQIEGPYNFDRVLDRLSMDPLNQLDRSERSLKLPLLADDKPFVIIIKATGSVEEPSFELAGTDDAHKISIIERTAEIFRWNVPLKDIYDHFQQTDLNEIFQQHLGTPIVLDFDPFGCLLKCIIHQQLNLSFAHTLTERFVKTFGYEIDGVWFYPQSETVAALTVEQLRELQFSGRKAEYVIGIAQAVANGELDIDALKNESEEVIFNKLIKLKGICLWTVQNFMMFGLGRPNLFPTADIGLQNALKKLYQLEAKPTLAEMESYVEGWNPYLSYASLYLWRSIE